MALTYNTIKCPSNFTILIAVYHYKAHYHCKRKYWEANATAFHVATNSFFHMNKSFLELSICHHFISYPPLWFPFSLFLIPTFCFSFSSSPLLLCTSVLSSALICYFLPVGSMWTPGPRFHLAMSENVKQFWLWKPATTWEGMEGGCKSTRKACPIKVSLPAYNYNPSYTDTGLGKCPSFPFSHHSPPVHSLHSGKQINWSGSQHFGTPQGFSLAAWMTPSWKQMPPPTVKEYSKMWSHFFHWSRERSSRITKTYSGVSKVSLQHFFAIVNDILMLEIQSLVYTPLTKYRV